MTAAGSTEAARRRLLERALDALPLVLAYILLCCLYAWQATQRDSPTIFTHSPEQVTAATASRDRAQARFSQPIATQIDEAGTFWPGEDYHQRYLEKKGLASCTVTLQGA